MRVRFEKLVYGGDALARVDGAAVFASFALPGEEAEIRITERKKKFQRGEATRILSASPDRIPPLCPFFTRCGGCQYQHASYEAQLRFKEEILRETLRRLGGVSWEQAVPVHRSPEWKYRNRAQWKTQLREAPPAPAVGYLQARSSRLCPVNVCPIVSPMLEKILSQLPELLRQNAQSLRATEIEAFADHADEKATLTIDCVTEPAHSESLAEALFAALPGAISIVFRWDEGASAIGYGEGFLQYQAAGKSYRVSHGSFFQVNRFLTGHLANRVAELAGGGSFALDLYAGVGLFSLLLAERFSRVLAVESNPAAAADLAENARSAANRIKPRHDDAENFLRVGSRGMARPDVAVVDPPRAGLSPEAVKGLCEFQPARIVYVACEPSTLARDLTAFCARGYSLAALELFDMFPQIYHIESVSVLEQAK